MKFLFKFTYLHRYIELYADSIDALPEDASIISITKL